jgi:HEAT repeat protein
MPIVRKSGGAPRATPTIIGIVEGLSSASEEVRWNAARAASGSAEYAAPLAAALHVEPTARVREALFTSLANMGNAGVAGVLPLLRSDDATLRTAALDALRILVRSAPDMLPPLLADADVDVRILSCELARMLPGDEATRLLCTLLHDEQQLNVCAAAVDVLAEVGQAEALPFLAACAARFPDAPFLAFAIRVAADRIRVQPALPRG